MKTILITGVAGLVGSNFSKYLIDKQKYKVIGIDDLSGGYKDYIPKDVIFYKKNLLDIKSVNNIFKKESPDYVYHFAAYAAEGLSPYIRNFNYSNNVLTSINIINSCVNYNIKKLIFTSSMAVYGHGTPPFKERDFPTPDDPYGIAKFTVEQDIKLANKQFGLKYNIIRPHNIIGINQNIWDKYRNVIGIWIFNVLNNKPITIYGDGLQTRAFSDIKYCLPYIEKLINNNYDNYTFNIGADNFYTIKECAEIVKSVSNKHGYKPKINFLEKRNEVLNAYCDHSKIKEIMGFEDKTNLQQCIEEMFIWALKQPKREIKLMEYEIKKNIYNFWKT
jgi:UDP-glucose 4-epimerase